MNQEPQAGRGTALEALAPSVLKVGKHAGTFRAGVHREVYVWTREDIATAVNAGADLVTAELGSERDQDLMNMVVNAVLHILENPNASLDEVIRENYEEEPEEVRSWWSGW
ncbi:hypothetical protein ACIQWR_18905 [Streptomyces sp. NPDC098789]|uniref:hypothetical protein n=1 Tax=Streptomyces sp. NPDC098789 TaxID=3366098 RepID=UPI003815CE45